MSLPTDANPTYGGEYWGWGFSPFIDDIDSRDHRLVRWLLDVRTKRSMKRGLGGIVPRWNEKLTLYSRIAGKHRADARVPSRSQTRRWPSVFHAVRGCIYLGNRLFSPTGCCGFRRMEVFMIQGWGSIVHGC